MTKTQNIKMLVLDVDGVLTDGTISYSSDGQETKSFNIKDGLGIKLLQKAGIGVAIITGRVSPMVERRANELSINPIIQGREDKGVALIELSRETNIDISEIAYMGDDLPDLSALEISGLALCPADAHKEVAAVADWIATMSGGKGAVREACDHILQSQGAYTDITQDFRGKE